MPSLHPLQDIRDDLKFAVRQLRLAPGFATVAALTLALGIGANSAIFALVDAALLRPVPLPAAERLVMIWERTDASPREPVSPLNMLDWHERNRTFEGISGFITAVGSMVMPGADGTAENVTRQWVPAAGIFDVLGIRPIAGRTFQESDERDRLNVVLLSESFWRSRFNADLSLIGRDLRLDGSPFTVVGVVPDEARLLGNVDMWALRPFSRDPNMRGARVLRVAGRLKPGVTIEAAREDLSAVAAGLASEYPASNAGRGVTIEPLRDALVGTDLRRTSLLFVAVVGFVLLICCANVANLLLTRASARSREVAVRSALGASRWRMARQLLTESLLLASIGGVLGLAIGAAILRVAPVLLPADMLPGAVTIGFDARVVAFCAAAALTVGVVFGIAPAWQAMRVSPAEINAPDTRTTTGGGTRVRSALVVGEVAMAVLLLIGAGLLLRTLVAVNSIDRGYRADDALTMIVDPLGSEYPTPASLQQFFDAVEHEVRTVPGVRDAAWASSVPLGPSYAGQVAFAIVGETPPDESTRPTADLQIVSSTYFSTLDLPVMSGRPFDARDAREAPPVALVNEAFARRYFGERSPVGRLVSVRPAGAPRATPVVREIVGVVRQVKRRPDEREELLQMYVPMQQVLLDDMFLLVRAEAGPPEAFAPAVRAAIARVDKQQLVSVREVMTLQDIAAEATALQRFRAVLVMTFAALALLLAMVGVFGTLGYAVQQRIREFGVRVALGASAGRVLALVMTNAARLVVIGAGIGLLAAVALSRLLAGMLVGVEPLDPLTFAAVVVLLLVSALASTAGPAWRATRVDPAATLRGE